jgi:hypothetical protein
MVMRVAVQNVAWVSLPVTHIKKAEYSQNLVSSMWNKSEYVVSFQVLMTASMKMTAF